MVSDMMTAEQLKGSILQLAMQGKLVPQEKGDGDGNNLLKRIVNSSDERSLINTKINYKEEGTTEIPDNWALTKLGVLGKLYSGFAFKSSQYVEKGIQIVRISDLAEDSISVKDAVYYPESEELKKYLIKKGSFLICMTGSIGKMARVTDDVPRYLNQRVGMFVPTQYCNADFLWYFLHSYDVINGWISAKTSTNGNIKNSNILDLICPLPPLAEQKRIVAKIEELMPFVEQYAAASTKLNTLNTMFPEMMKKSILQEAVQGKLVPQDPNDEPASLLLKKIAEEKKRLIREGKIRKQKPLPEITEDEIPFEIPESWEWIRLSDISKQITDGEHSTPKRVSDFCGFYLLSARNVRDGEIKLDDVDYVDNSEFERISSRCNPVKGDILISCSGSVGRCAVVNDDNKYVMVRSAAMASPIMCDPNYLMYAIQSDCVQRQINALKKQTAQANLFLGAIAVLKLPLPPYNEQKRIVSKLNQVLSHTEKAFNTLSFE